MALLELKNVSFYDGFTQVIKDTSLSIEKGSVTALLGDSGGGKSTVLKLISGIVPPSSGKVFYNDKDFSKMNEKDKMFFLRDIYHEK